LDIVINFTSLCADHRQKEVNESFDPAVCHVSDCLRVTTGCHVIVGQERPALGPRLLPVNEAPREPELAAFLERLRKSVHGRNAEEVLAAMSESFWNNSTIGCDCLSPLFVMLSSVIDSN